MLLGVAAARIRLLPEGSSAFLDAFVIRLALPGLVLAEISTAELGLEILTPVVVAWAQLAVLAAIVVLGGRLVGAHRATVGTLLLVVPLGNTGFLGYPAVTALLGRELLPLAVVYDQLGTFLAIISYAGVVASRYGVRPPDGTTGAPAADRPGTAEGAAGAVPDAAGDGEVADRVPTTPRARIRRLLAFPPFPALLLAVAFRPVGLPAPVLQVAELLGASVVPLAMIAIGMRLRVGVLGQRPKALAVGLALRMVAAPAGVLLAATALGASGPEWQVSTLQAAMSPNVTASVIAAAVGLDEQLAVGLSGLGVVLAMVTLPLWALAVT